MFSCSLTQKPWDVQTFKNELHFLILHFKLFSNPDGSTLSFVFLFFRWLLCSNHTEPVKGFLGRFLRRKLLETEINSRARNSDLVKIVEWIPCVWQHLNRFLETHSSSDVTIGEFSFSQSGGALMCVKTLQDVLFRPRHFRSALKVCNESTWVK